MATAAISGGDDRLDGLCRSLRSGLGGFGYQWLCACAIYPRLRFALSGYLGTALAEALGRPPLAEGEMLALYRLPWFRDGYMPTDLRLRLLADLEPEARVAAQDAIARILYAATLDEAGETASEPLAVPEPPGRWQTMLRAFVDAAPEGAVERDVLFARCLAGRSTTAAGIARDRARVRIFGWAGARLWTWRTAALLGLCALLLGGWASSGSWLKPFFESERIVMREVAVPASPAPAVSAASTSDTPPSPPPIPPAAAPTASQTDVQPASETNQVETAKQPEADIRSEPIKAPDERSRTMRMPNLRAKQAPSSVAPPVIAEPSAEIAAKPDLDAGGAKPGSAYAAKLDGQSDDYYDAGNFQESVALNTKTCEMGSYRGCFWNGFIYETGKGVPKDVTVALRWYGRSCELGLKQGCDSRARLQKQALNPTDGSSPTAAAVGWVWLGTFKDGRWSEQYFDQAATTRPDELKDRQIIASGDVNVRSDKPKFPLYEVDSAVVATLRSGRTVQVVEVARAGLISSNYWALVRYENAARQPAGR